MRMLQKRILHYLGNSLLIGMLGFNVFISCTSQTKRIDSETRLPTAARCAALEIGQDLFSSNFPVNIDYRDEENFLMCAAYHGHDQVVKMLLEKGARIDAQTQDGKTALMCAAYHGHDQVVKMLLEKGARIDAQTQDGKTALMCAAYHGHDQVVKMLLDKGAKVDAQTQDGETALSLAFHKGYTEIVEILKVVDRSYKNVTLTGCNDSKKFQKCIQEVQKTSEKKMSTRHNNIRRSSGSERRLRNQSSIQPEKYKQLMSDWKKWEINSP